MDRVERATPEVTRQRLADRHIDIPYWERIARARSIDLRGNLRVVHLDNGYARAVPLNPALRWNGGR